MTTTTAAPAVDLRRPRFKTVIFDVDSTVCAIEGIDWLAARRDPDVARESEALTAQAMAGESPIEAVYTRRLERIRPTAGELISLAEAYRVLKRGGRFLCLEFSSVNLPGLDKIYEAYSFTAIPAMGKAVTGDGQPYRYLVESIRKFPHPETFRDMIEDAGFKRSTYTRLTGGVVAIHSGWKL